MSPAPVSSRGGAGGPSCLVNLAATPDWQSATDHVPRWNELYDGYAYNPLAAIPAGLGLTFAFDGSDVDGYFTATVAGLWAFDLAIGLKLDATAAGLVWVVPAEGLSQVGPGITAQWAGQTFRTFSHLAILPLAVGATAQPQLSMHTAATSAPYAPQVATMLVTRLA